jgi:hypothetical protein
MLNGWDEPTIRNAILKRLSVERGIRLLDIKIKRHKDNVAIGVLAQLDTVLLVRSRFDLPPEFEYTHLHNEIDQIAEQYKCARIDYWRNGRPEAMPEREVIGTGLRGLWATHGG